MTRKLKRRRTYMLKIHVHKNKQKNMCGVMYMLVVQTRRTGSLEETQAGDSGTD